MVVVGNIRTFGCGLGRSREVGGELSAGGKSRAKQPADLISSLVALCLRRNIVQSTLHYARPFELLGHYRNGVE